jgi:predicted nucleotide-binding protein
MASWNCDAVRDTLRNNGFQIISETRLGNDLGWSFVCSGGEIVCVYDTGKIAVQGKGQAPVKALFGQAAAPAAVASIGGAAKPTGGTGNRKVFVVYGHDGPARTELEAMLRRWGLDPLIFDQLTSGGQTIIEKLERVRQEAGFAVVLATPDDEGHRAEHPEEKAHRARQNVVLELGMMLSVLGRDRVAILMKDQDRMERPSDIQGLIYIPFKDEVSEAALTLAKEINAKGITIDIQKV